MRTIQSEKTIEYYVEKYDMASFLNDELLSRLQRFRFPAYSSVFIEQDEPHFFYFLVEGAVQCSHYHLNGKLAVFAVSRPFTAIGDLEILSNERVHSNVIATERTTMLGIAASDIHRYGADDPRFLRFLLDELRQKLYRVNELQMNQVLPVINRLAVYILSLLLDENAEHVTLPGKEELASLLGTTTRHLNRVLKELVENDSISADYPRVRVKDRAALEQIAQ